MICALIILDAHLLDVFVFDEIEALFKRSKQDPQLFKLLHSDKIVFFLHLLGLDTNGHTHRPHSQEYLNNIKVVDAGIKKIERILKDFYTDDATAFVVTADHGMSDRGNATFFKLTRAIRSSRRWSS